MQDVESVLMTTKSHMAAAANAFDGSRIISQGGAVVAQIQAIGGVSKLTAAEQAAANRTLDAALLKYHALGKEAPPGMQELASATRSAGQAAAATGGQAQTLNTVYRQFDGILQSVGVNIGPYVKGLEDILALGGKTAAVVAGVALATKAVVSYVEARAKASLQAETEGAKQDVVNRAIAAGAKESIAYADAVTFLVDKAKEAAQAQVDWNAKLSAAKAEVKGLTQAQIDEIAVAKQLGATTEEITAKFRLSADAQRILSNETRTSSQVIESNAQQMSKLASQIDAARQRRERAAEATNDESKATIDNTIAVRDNASAQAELTAALQAREQSMQAIADAEAARRQANDAFMNAQTLNDRRAEAFEVDIPALTGFALDSVVNRFRAPGETDPNAALQRALETLSAQEGRYKVTDNESFYAMQRDQVLLAQLRMWQRGQGAPGFANGVRDFPGGAAWVGERGPELVTLPPHSNVIPNHAIGGTSVQFAAGAIVVQGPVVGGIDHLADMIGASVMKKLKGQGVRLPVGA